MTEKRSFGALLKQLRKRAGMTQRDLAVALNYSDSLISSLENAQRRPDLHAVTTRFIPALGLQDDPATAALLIECAAAASGDDVPEPVTLYSVVSYGTRAVQAKHSRVLPIVPNELIGRDEEVHRLCNRLLGHHGRLLTLVGPPGIGKTQLALAVAARLQRHYSDGALFVPLAAIVDSIAMAATIVAAVGGSEASAKPPQIRLIEVLRRKHILLVLDNCEQIVGAAPLIAEVVAACPQLSILATSRERLHLRAEQRYRVPALDLAAAVELFALRAAALDVDFTITAANRPTLEAICQRLDRLPLALELCAAQVDLFAPAQILAQLRARPLDLLINGAHDLPPQHRTLRHAIQRSYELLAEHERVLFRRLGIFKGGWSLEAMEAVCAREQALDRRMLVETLRALIGKSLVRAETPLTDERRFLMLETIREYALERLEASGESEQLRGQHAAYYQALGEHVWLTEDGPVSGGAWVRRLQPDYENFQSALVWSQSTAGNSEAALQLCSAMEGLWASRGMRYEAIAAMERALDHPRGAGRTGAHWIIRWDLARLFTSIGNYTAARMHAEEAVLLARELGDINLSAQALERLGAVARDQGDSASAWARFNESLAILRELGDPHSIANALNTLAGVAIMEEDPARAELLLAESREIGQRAGSASDCFAWTLTNLGHAAQLRGDYARAAQLHHESLVRFGSTDYPLGPPTAYHGLGEAALGQGNTDEAARWFAQGLVLSQRESNLASIAWCLAGLGSVAAKSEAPERAARLWGAAEQLRQTIGCRSAPATRATYEQAIAVARCQGAEGSFAAAWAAGQALSLDEVIADALAKA
jgi:predicted ATPase/DNA-binding XRE family transcriptional regulator